MYKNYINILSYIRKLNDDYSLDEIIDGLNKLNIVCIPLLKRSKNEINLL